MRTQRRYSLFARKRGERVWQRVSALSYLGRQKAAEQYQGMLLGQVLGELPPQWDGHEFTLKPIDNADYIIPRENVYRPA